MQDMPPVGGFPSIRIQRRLPSTGPTGVAIFAVGAAVMAYGYYNVSAVASVMCCMLVSAHVEAHIAAAWSSHSRCARICRCITNQQVFHMIQDRK